MPTAHAARRCTHLSRGHPPPPPPSASPSPPRPCSPGAESSARRGRGGHRHRRADFRCRAQRAAAASTRKGIRAYTTAASTATATAVSHVHSSRCGTVRPSIHSCVVRSARDDYDNCVCMLGNFNHVKNTHLLLGAAESPYTGPLHGAPTRSPYYARQQEHSLRRASPADRVS